MPLCVKKAKKKFVSLLLQNELVMLVAYFTWHFNEACPIKFVNVKQSFDNLHPSSFTKSNHVICIQYTKIAIDNVNQTL